MHYKSLEDYLGSEILSVFLASPESQLMQHLTQETLSMEAEDVVTPQLRQLLQKPSACHKPFDLKRPHLQWQQVIQSSGPVRVTASLTRMPKKGVYSVKCACKVKADTAAGSRAWSGQHWGIYWYPQRN